MAAVIYAEERFIALCRVVAHTEKEREPVTVELFQGPVTLRQIEHSWDLEVLAVLQQGINAHIAEPAKLKPGSPVHLRGLGKGQSAYSPWDIEPTIRKSSIAYFPAEHPIHARLADALTLLTEEEKSTLLEEVHV